MTEHVRVTVTDDATGDSETKEIWDDYCLVAAGGCEVERFDVYNKADGTQTHVITVKGVRRA